MSIFHSKNHNNYMKIVLILLVVMFGLSGVSIAFNATDSLKEKMFVMVPVKYTLIKKNSYVAFHKRDSFFDDILVTKKVVAVSGDSIKVKNNEVIVNEKHLIIKANAKNGAILHPVSISTVPHGKLFVAGDNPDSFDSRYEEFGLVDEKDINYVSYGII